jgi:hypothetical protein
MKRETLIAVEEAEAELAELRRRDAELRRDAYRPLSNNPTDKERLESEARRLAAEKLVDQLRAQIWRQTDKLAELKVRDADRQRWARELSNSLANKYARVNVVRAERALLAEIERQCRAWHADVSTRRHTQWDGLTRALEQVNREIGRLVAVARDFDNGVEMLRLEGIDWAPPERHERDAA